MNPSNRAKHYIESKVQSPITVFHGTTSLFLRDILKFGLSVDHNKQGVWVEEELNSNPSRKSHAGVYLTRSGFRAMSYASAVCRKLGGDTLVVAVTLRPNSALPDEDDFLWTCSIVVDTRMNPIGDNTFMLASFIIPLLLSKHPLTEPAFIAYKTYAMPFLRMSDKRQDTKAIDHALFNLMVAEMQRKLAYYRTSFRNDYDRNKIDYDLCNSLGAHLHHQWREPQEVPEEYQWIFQHQPQAHWEHVRRQALEQLILQTKHLVKPRVNDYFKEENGTMRLLQGVGFSGGSRITGLFTLNEPSYNDVVKQYVLTIIYGTCPPSFIQTYKERQGMDPKNLVIQHRK